MKISKKCGLEYKSLGFSEAFNHISWDEEDHEMWLKATLIQFKISCRFNILQSGYIINVSCYWLPGFGKTLILCSKTNPISITTALLRSLQTEFTLRRFMVWICISLQYWSSSTEETRDTVKKPITAWYHFHQRGFWLSERMWTHLILLDKVAWPMEAVLAHCSYCRNRAVWDPVASKVTADTVIKSFLHLAGITASLVFGGFSMMFDMFIGPVTKWSLFNFRLFSWLLGSMLDNFTVCSCNSLHEVYCIKAYKDVNQLWTKVFFLCNLRLCVVF